MVPDLETLSALRSLFDQVDFKKFRAFLEAVERDEIYRAVHATENHGVAQGRAQMAVWLRAQIEDCKQLAANMEKRTYDQAAARRSRGIGTG